MNKKKELARNTIIFGIGTAGAKLIRFVLIPLYTIYMTTSEFSLADNIMSTIALIAPLLMLGLSGGCLRFAIGHSENWKPIVFLAGVVSFGGFTILLLLSPVLNRIMFFEGYGFWIPFLYLFYALKAFLAQLCKGMEKNESYAFDGILAALTLTTSSIVLISKLNMGVIGYLMATLISEGISIIYLSIQCKLFSLAKHARYNRKLTVEMLRYSLPLMPNELSWWIIQMSDRFMIIWICGFAINGVYAMAYKIPAIFNLIVSMFIQAFGISAIKECENLESRAERIDGSFFEDIYRKYVAVSFLVVAIIILLVKPLAYVLQRNDFFDAWKYTPFLLCAYAVGNLQAFYGSIYSGIKKSKVILLSTVCGAISNIILNIFLIPAIGAYGAALATIVSYVVVYLIRVISIKKYVDMNHFEIKIACSLAILFFMIGLYLQNNIQGFVGSVMIGFVLPVIYRKEIAELCVLLKHLVDKWKMKNN